MWQRCCSVLTWAGKCRLKSVVASKKSLAYVTVLVVCTAGILKAWVLDKEQSWPIYVWLPILLLALWAIWTLRDPPDPKAKAFDFSPSRGLLYFILGFFIFPIVAIINAVFGAELSLSSMLLFTVVGSTVVGIAGLFTEHIGI